MQGECTGSNQECSRHYNSCADIDVDGDVLFGVSISSGYYIYTEASTRSPGETATLISPTLNSAQAYCLRFWYHMHGADMGALNVFLRPSSTLIWVRAGEHVIDRSLQSVGNRFHSYNITELEDCLVLQSRKGGKIEQEVQCGCQRKTMRVNTKYVCEDKKL